MDCRELESYIENGQTIRVFSSMPAEDAKLFADEWRSVSAESLLGLTRKLPKPRDS